MPPAVVPAPHTCATQSYSQIGIHLTTTVFGDSLTKPSDSAPPMARGGKSQLGNMGGGAGAGWAATKGEVKLKDVTHCGSTQVLTRH